MKFSHVDYKNEYKNHSCHKKVFAKEKGDI